MLKKIVHLIIYSNIIIYVSISRNLFGQEIPANRFYLERTEFSFDMGENWETNSVFGSYRFVNIKKNIARNDSSEIKYNSHFGFSANEKNDFEIFSYLLIQHNNYYSYLNPRIVTNPNGFNRFSGISRNIKRFGFNSGETDISGIGIKKYNTNFQIGRGRESWGAGNDIQIVLSNNSPSYDYLKFMYEYSKFRFVYFHGFLENINEYNRYITGRAFEITNNKSIIFGISEIAIYSGVNRPIDLSYMNPISNHLEIELNDRQNLLGVNDANATWQISTDIFTRNKYRLSANILLDEIILDKIELDSGKVNGVGWSFRIGKNKIIKNNIFVFYFDMTSLSTHVLRHVRGYNNFVQRGMPLGWSNGSDGYEIKFGCNFFNNNNLIIKTKAGKKVQGASSIINNPYDPYTDKYKKGPFPSKPINETLFIDLRMHWKPKMDYNIVFSTIIDKLNNELVFNSNIMFSKELFKLK